MVGLAYKTMTIYFLFYKKLIETKYRQGKIFFQNVDNMSTPSPIFAAVQGNLSISKHNFLCI